MARAVVLPCVAAIVVFAIVQDRLTSAGVGQYVSAYRDAAAGRRAAVTIDEVMKPAVGRAVQHGALWGGAVLIVGLGSILGSTLAARRRSGRG